MNSPIKVLQLISSGGYYGAERVVVQLAGALNQLGCRAVVGVFDNAHRPNLEIAEIARLNGLDVEVIKCNGKFDIRTTSAIRDCLSKGEFDVLHTHGYKADFYGYRAARTSGTKIVATSHNWPSRKFSLRLYAAIDRLVLRYFDRVCAVSDEIKGVLERSGVPREMLSVVPNGIPVDQFSSGRQVLKAELGFQENTIVGFVGRMSKEKGLEHLINIVPGLVAIAPSTRFVFVGEGPERSALERLTRHLHVEENVLFLGRREDLADVYAGIDVFVLPSLNEGMPLVLLEAMAAGRPVVATRVGEIPKIIKDGESGLLVEPGDEQGLRGAITQLLQQPELRGAICEQAKALVKKHYTLMQMAENYVGIYEQALSAA